MKGADEGPGTGIDYGLRNSMDWESRHGRVAGKLQRSIPRVDKKRENECGCRTQHHLLCYRTGKVAEPPVLKPSQEEGSHPCQRKSLNGLGLKHKATPCGRSPFAGLDGTVRGSRTKHRLNYCATIAVVVGVCGQRPRRCLPEREDHAPLMYAGTLCACVPVCRVGDGPAASPLRHEPTKPQCR